MKIDSNQRSKSTSLLFGEIRERLTIEAFSRDTSTWLRGDQADHGAATEQCRLLQEYDNTCLRLVFISSLQISDTPLLWRSVRCTEFDAAKAALVEVWGKEEQSMVERRHDAVKAMVKGVSAKTLPKQTSKQVGLAFAFGGLDPASVSSDTILNHSSVSDRQLPAKKTG